MADNGLTMKVACDLMTETIDEFSALYRDGSGLPLHVSAEATAFLFDCMERRTIEVWFVIVPRSIRAAGSYHLEVLLTKRMWALLANLRSARGVVLGHA